MLQWKATRPEDTGGGDSWARSIWPVSAADFDIQGRAARVSLRRRDSATAVTKEGYHSRWGNSDKRLTYMVVRELELADKISGHLQLPGPHDGGEPLK